MPVEITQDTPLAEALNAAILPKLLEVGWGTGGPDDAALAEYIVLMLVNGKTQDEIAAELAADFLNLPADDPTVRGFSGWLFEQIETLNAQLNGQPAVDDSMGSVAHENGHSGDMDTDMNTGAGELNAPTGPRSMRNGNFRGGREKRMLGQMSKAMNRQGDNVLHRVRGNGNERINTHGRAPPTGPRTGQGRLPRNNVNRQAASIQAGLEGMGGPAGSQFFMQGAGQPSQMDLVAMLEQQNQMMFQLSQQLMNGGGGHNGGYGGHRGRGGNRSQDQNRNNFRKHHNQNQNNQSADGSKPEGAGDGEDVDMSGNKREPPNPDETVCKYNLNCTNRDCKFAHQSPAAPHGTTVDVNDVCSFGAACKNRKCVGRHPSPAQRAAHQSEQDCKFFPNCQNPRCPFKHPSMPLCRNGADCTTPNCKFTHVKTKCKFNPCLNPHCAFLHEEGQQGGFKDKVWTSETTKEHVSERKFVDDQAREELVKPDGDDAMTQETLQDTEVIG